MLPPLPASVGDPLVTRVTAMSVDFEQRGPFAIVTINRPEARNAVNPAVAQGVEEAIV